MTVEGQEFIVRCHQEDLHTKHIYHMRYVFKAKTVTQVKQQLNAWFKRYQVHMYGAVSKITKTIILRGQATLNTIISPL
ncbi:hypothetical protein [Bacillus thuringiensis]|uniref:Transposase n=1 Tax=Bacillus thuringiensis TaxID=1428 RepID=A0ABD6R4X0_BACTU|nr:hypothetical protein [Bacillus thuringiensis]OPD49257.1 hypothetical protein BVF97_19670 [Bacillus thuringiensis]